MNQITLWHLRLFFGQIQEQFEMEKCCCSILPTSAVFNCNCTLLMGWVELVKGDLLQNLHLNCFRELRELKECWYSQFENVIVEMNLNDVFFFFLFFFCSSDTTLPLFIVWNFALALQGQNKMMSTGLVLYIILRRNCRKSKPLRNIICGLHKCITAAGYTISTLEPAWNHPGPYQVFTVVKL